MDKSIPYHEQGRSTQKGRTRAAIVEAAVRLAQQGGTPSVQAAADEAGVGRGTAYRYFPNQRDLLAAAHPEVAAASLLPPDPPSDPAERLRLVVREITNITQRTEPALRTMLRLSLESGPPTKDLPLRKGRRIIWVADALAPLADSMDEKRFDALAVAIAAVVGIEVFVWLSDIAGLDPDTAADLICWNAEALFQRAMADDSVLPGQRLPRRRSSERGTR